MKKNILRNTLCLSLSALVLSTSISTTAFARNGRNEELEFSGDDRYSYNNPYAGETRNNLVYSPAKVEFQNPADRVGGRISRVGSTITVDLVDDRIDDVTNVVLRTAFDDGFAGVGKLVYKGLTTDSAIPGSRYRYVFEGMTPSDYVLEVSFKDGTVERHRANLYGEAHFAVAPHAKSEFNRRVGGKAERFNDTLLINIIDDKKDEVTSVSLLTNNYTYITTATPINRGYTSNGSPSVGSFYKYQVDWVKGDKPYILEVTFTDGTAEFHHINL